MFEAERIANQVRQLNAKEFGADVLFSICDSSADDDNQD
ncbi:hypothetical protein S7335_1732 [Synechococcus sp. PCC 7335]|nr:hypothetical protein S7335_1732 [Synechococcus sp. PCC 7335]